MGIVSA
jgi:hypothetical protein